jgi:hypothetical protein
VLVWSLVGKRMMITDTSAEAVAKLVYEREALSLAICGGEDAPGYAASLPVAVLEEVARSNRSSHIQALETVSRDLRHWREECGKLHSRNDTLAARVAELESLLAGRTFTVDEGREWEARAKAAEVERDHQRANKDAAYLERNHLVALLASHYPSGIKRTETSASVRTSCILPSGSLLNVSVQPAVDGWIVCDEGSVVADVESHGFDVAGSLRGLASKLTKLGLNVQGGKIYSNRVSTGDLPYAVAYLATAALDASRWLMAAASKSGKPSVADGLPQTAISAQAESCCVEAPRPASSQPYPYESQGLLLSECGAFYALSGLETLWLPLGAGEDA